MNGADLSGYIFIGAIVYALYKWFAPRIKKFSDDANSMSVGAKEEAIQFLSELSAGQIMMVQTWMKHKGISSSLMNSIGLHRYVVLEENGIERTLKNSPECFIKALKRIGFEDGKTKPSGFNASKTESISSKEEAIQFLSGLSAEQIILIRTWTKHEGVSSSLMDSIGLHRYVVLEEGGIGLTLKNSPECFIEALKRVSVEDSPVKPSENVTRKRKTWSNSELARSGSKVWQRKD